MKKAYFDQEVTDVLTSLKFINKFEKGYKVDLFNNTLCRDTYINAAWRTLNDVCYRKAQNRNQLLDYLKKMSKAAIDLCYKIHNYNSTDNGVEFKEYNKSIIGLILEELKSSQIHQEMISQTYETDAYYISQVKAHLDVLKEDIKELERTVLNYDV